MRVCVCVYAIDGVTAVLIPTETNSPTDYECILCTVSKLIDYELYNTHRGLLAIFTVQQKKRYSLNYLLI